MAIPSKEELLREWAGRDPVVYGCWKQQAEQGLTDEEMWRAMVAIMADRHAHLQKVYERLAAQSPPSPFVKIQ